MSDASEQPSASGSQDIDYTRSIARRVFAIELNATSHSFQPGDDERSPRYVLLPTGQRANRVVISGAATEAEKDGTRNGEAVYRLRIHDGTESVYAYAGVNEPRARDQISSLDVPATVMVVGKPRVYESEDDETSYVSIQPEHVVEVGTDTRQRWARQTAAKTLARIDAIESEDVTSEDIDMAHRFYSDQDFNPLRDAVHEGLQQAFRVE
jgi:RPA family protein